MVDHDYPMVYVCISLHVNDHILFYTAGVTKIFIENFQKCNNSVIISIFKNRFVRFSKRMSLIFAEPSKMGVFLMIFFVLCSISTKAVENL